MRSQQDQQAIQKFFDQQAADYLQRYHSDRPFTAYLHWERLQLALRFIRQEGPLLDIGAGPGKLYEELKLRAMYPAIDYYACDLSSSMLAASSIPADKRWQGSVMQAPSTLPSLQTAVLLGVTSYMSEAEWSQTETWLWEHLAPGGRLIVTFTHQNSLDFRIRQFLRLLIPGRWIPGTLAGQSFSTLALSKGEALYSLSRWEKVDFFWTNHGVSPFNRLFPKLTLAWVRLCTRYRKRAPFWLPWFSGDLLVVVQKPGETGK